MCDFSLQSVRSRPAKVGDKLVTRDSAPERVASPRPTISVWQFVCCRAPNSPFPATSLACRPACLPGGPRPSIIGRQFSAK